jgi:RNA polymerase sigma-70 factor (ECF subfamily)
MRDDMEGDDVVEAALARLPARDREAVELAAWEELTLPQIARVMGCSHDALRLRLNSAHHRFARALADLDAS